MAIVCQKCGDILIEGIKPFVEVQMQGLICMECIDKANRLCVGEIKEQVTCVP